MRRAVFSDLQRRGLEKRFQIQKYISKPDRKKLAEKLGLKDSQVSRNNLYTSSQRTNTLKRDARPRKSEHLPAASVLIQT